MSVPPPNQGAAANSHPRCPLDAFMKLEPHLYALHPLPVAVAELGR